MTNKVYIFVGPAGSGKTSLIKKLVAKTGLKFYDVLKVMKPYLKKYGTVTEKNKKVLDRVVMDYVKSFSKKKFDILEFATGGYLPVVLQYLRNKEVIVVYSKCPLAICRKRMRTRSREVPDHYVKYQSKFKTAFYRKLMRTLDFKLIVIDMKKGEKECFKELMRRINN